MSLDKAYDGYKSFSYLKPGVDYRPFDLADELARVPPFRLPLDYADEARVTGLAERSLFVSMHEHLGVFPDRIEETPDYVRHGRMSTAFEGLAAVAVGCRLRQPHGWHLHDSLVVRVAVGRRSARPGHAIVRFGASGLLIPCLRVGDVQRAHDEGRIAWVATMEGAAMIEHDLDRIDILHGFGLRSLGVTYSESNALAMA